MRAIGEVRRVDNLGRIVIPAVLRKGLEIGLKAPIEMYVDGESIILMKYKKKCVFCNTHELLGSFRGKIVCINCIKELRKLNKTQKIFTIPNQYVMSVLD